MIQGSRGIYGVEGGGLKAKVGVVWFGLKHLGFVLSWTGLQFQVVSSFVGFYFADVWVVKANSLPCTCRGLSSMEATGKV